MLLIGFAFTKKIILKFVVQISDDGGRNEEKNVQISGSM